ncbi:MAG: hypothetical protein GQ574_05645 [Crocinitomix sp.]|nr:hypothetical protein [Crocinitomix sp.]
MIFRKKLPYLFILTLLVASCNREKFDTEDSDFQNIYNNLIDDGNDWEVTMDTEVHAYDFILSEDRTIKSIGYQSHSDLTSTEYVIGILNNIDSSIVYSEGHLFNSDDISYAIPSSTVNLESGVPYTISRIQTNWATYITQTIGHGVRTDSTHYPVSNGVLTITETNSHDYGETNYYLTDYILPRIDLVFE